MNAARIARNIADAFAVWGMEENQNLSLDAAMTLLNDAMTDEDGTRVGEIELSWDPDGTTVFGFVLPAEVCELISFEESA